MLKRIAEMLGFRRSIEAGGHGARWPTVGIRAPAREVLVRQEVAGARAVGFVLNSPYGAALLNAWTSNLVGDGPAVRPSIEDDTARADLIAQFNRWWDEADADGLTDFGGLLQRIAACEFIHGEAFVHFLADPATGAMRIRLLDPAQIDRSVTRDMGNGARIICGIELDAAGRRVAYHVRPAIDGPLNTMFEVRRIPAADIIHIFAPAFPGQMRGLSRIAPVATRLQGADQLEDALLQKAQTAALFGVVLHKPDAGSGFGVDPNGDMNMEPGSVMQAPPGWSVETITPPHDEGGVGFLRSQLRAIAAGVGVPYELVASDLSQVNYSSARIGLLEFRRRITSIRNTMLRRALDLIWRRWLLMEALSNRFDLEAAAHVRAEFVWPGWDHVDPKKETEADVLAVAAGFKSRFEVIGGRGRERIKRATAWTVHEISFVPLPADAGASTRENPMPTEAETQEAPATETRASTEQMVNRAGVNAAIRSLATSLSLPATWSDAQIDAGASEEQARAAALNEMLERGAQNVPTARASVGTDYTDPAIRARAMGEGLYTRINRAHNPSEQARAYAHMGIQDLARDCLNVRGLRTTGSSADIIKRALHSTSDFPLLLGDAVGRTLRDGYTIAGSALKPLGRQSNLTDFRTRHRLQLSDGPELEPLNEAGEIKAGSLTEAKESYNLTTYAKRIGITRQILVNDDLGAFSDIGRRLGQGAASTEAKLLTELLVSNPKMADGKGVFHADHGNLAATAAALSIDSLSAARLAMRRQKSLTGQPIQVAPKYLIVPPELETSAEKILHEITAATAADVNPFSNSLTLVVEPRLTNATAWYLASDTGQIDGFEWAYLDSEEGPQLDTRAGWEIEGVEVKCRLDFGAGWVEHRGWYKNAGA